MASSEHERQGGAPLDLDPGESVLARLDGRESLIASLPPSAFQNLLIVTVARPGAVEAAVRDAGGDPANVGIVPVSASPLDYNGACWTANRVSPSDLTGISIQFSRGERYLTDGSGWVVVDGLGTMLMYAEEGNLYRLLSHLIGRAREKRLRHVTGVVESVVSDSTLARFGGLHDRAIPLE